MDNITKEEKYKTICTAVKSLLHDKEKVCFLTASSNLLNLLKRNFDYMNWIGYYFYNDDKKELYLGSFIGELACNTISIDKGVCGKCIREMKTQVVEDVTKVAYHIACSSKSQSEIVVPMTINGRIIGEIDIDSNEMSSFNATDKKYLEAIAYLLMKF